MPPAGRPLRLRPTPPGARLALRPVSDARRVEEIPTPRAYVRSVEEILDDLRGYHVRAMRQRDLLVGSLEMLDAIARRRDVLLEQLADAKAREAAATPSGS